MCKCDNNNAKLRYNQKRGNNRVSVAISGN